MKVITSISRKGGVGKTSSLIALAMVAAERGVKTMLLDTDSGQPFLRWKTKAEENNYWEDCIGHSTIFDGGNDDIVARVETCMGNGYELVLIDTKGGEGELVAYIAQLADLILVPMAASEIDVAGADETFEWLESLTENGFTVGEVRGLVTRVPSESSMSKANADWLKNIYDNFATLETQMPVSKVIENQIAFGLFSKIIEDFLSTDEQKYKFQARHYQKVMHLYARFYKEALEIANG